MPPTKYLTSEPFDESHPLHAVAATSAVCAEADEQELITRHERNDAIRQAWESGVTVAELTRASGLSRHSIYKMIDTSQTRPVVDQDADAVQAVSAAASAFSAAEWRATEARDERDAAIRHAAASGLSKASIARAAGITARTVFLIIRR